MQEKNFNFAFLTTYIISWNIPSMRYPNIKYLLLFFLSGNISYGGVDIIFDYSYDTGNCLVMIKGI